MLDKFFLRRKKGKSRTLKSVLWTVHYELLGSIYIFVKRVLNNLSTFDSNKTVLLLTHVVSIFSGGGGIEMKW